MDNNESNNVEKSQFRISFWYQEQVKHRGSILVEGQTESEVIKKLYQIINEFGKDILIESIEDSEYFEDPQEDVHITDASKVW